MKYFYVGPMDPGEFGDDIVMTHDTRPPTVVKLDVSFEGYFGDALLEPFPCFIGTDVLVHAILDRRLTGTEIAAVKTSIADQYDSSYCKPEDIPHFHWLKIVGIAGLDDFGLAPKHKLVVSERALNVLNSLGIENAEVEPYQRGK